MIRKVILSGKLGKMFGREHHFDISTPAEAIRALSVNFDGFSQYLIESGKDNVGYRVMVDNKDIAGPENIADPFSRTVRIIPVVAGAKSGFFQILAGVALVALAFVTGGVSLTATGLAFSGLAGQLAFGLGASLALGGVAQMLSPQPKAQGPIESPENKPSYTFSGPVNTTAQGQPVAVGYGRLIVGSAVVSAGITADDYTAAGVE